LLRRRHVDACHYFHACHTYAMLLPLRHAMQRSATHLRYARFFDDCEMMPFFLPHAMLCAIRVLIAAMLLIAIVHIGYHIIRAIFIIADYVFIIFIITPIHYD